MHFSENFLHFIWQFRLFNTSKLFCAHGEELKVLSPGLLNKHAGPDFSEAKLIIGQTTWAGNVEVHLKSSDWLVHGHQDDSFYDSVVLHVVYKHDKPIHRTNGSLIPVLVLENLFPERLLINYNELIASINKYPCEKHISQVDPIIINGFLSRIIIERFEQKSEEVFNKLNDYKGDWDETFYHFIAKSFGFKVNALPFELLAGALPQQILAKHKDNNMQIAALIFGQSGFLKQSLSAGYPIQLQHEYLFLQKKYRLEPIDASLWKFLRMRPQNFPTVRLAQFAALISKSSHLFSKILQTKDLTELYALFNDLPVNEYWQTHYHFNKSAKQVKVQLGAQSINSIIINTVCLFLFSYGKYTDQSQFIDKALDLLEKIPAESNSIIDQYKDSGIIADNGFMSQALLQLNKSYCSQKKCLNCGIGIKILKR